MVQKNLIGQEILGYTVIENLGSGAFGTVYKAVKTNVSGQYVRAIKHITIPTEKQYRSVLNSMGGSVSKADSYFSQMISNIVSEITILNDLTEKGAQNIVRYYENDIQICESPIRYDIYILMEYLTPLGDYITSTQFQVRDCVRLAFDVLTGLRSCHENNVIHRDIKIDNIFVSASGSFKIGDFGVSKVLKDSSKAESLKGTPDYLAPEVYLGKEGYTKSVDLYSLGIVLYRLLNYNRNPFLPPFPQQYFSRDEDLAFEERISGKIPPLPLLGGEEIGKVIVKAISPPEERFVSAQEFREALEEAVDQTSDEILKMVINYEIDDTGEENSMEEWPGDTLGETLGETIGEHLTEIEPDDEFDDDKNSTIHRHLFETVSEDQQEKPPKVDISDETNWNRETAQENGADDTGADSYGTVVHSYDPVTDPDDAGARKKKNKKESRKQKKEKPDKEDRVVKRDAKKSAKSDPDRTAKPEKKKPDTKEKEKKAVSMVPIVVVVFIVILVLILVSGMMFMMPILFVIWLAAFIAALYFAGRQLNQKPETNAPNADMRGREPYLQILNVSMALKQAREDHPGDLLDQTLYDVKRIEERLSAETDFGTGEDEVTECENSIAKQIRYACRTAQDLDAGEMEENLKGIRTAMNNIQFLLDKRRELARR